MDVTCEINDQFQVSSAFSDLNDLIKSASKALSAYIDSLPQYLIKEMQHPRKKPRGSIRRKRREVIRNDNRRNV